MNLFQTTAGTIAGHEHIRLGKNNQDAWHINAQPEYTIALVADGCSSGVFSEVGAQIGVQLAANYLSNQLEQNSNFFELKAAQALQQCQIYLLNEIGTLIHRMAGTFEAILSNYFLFTLVGAVITPRSATFFSLGDGVIVVNERIIQIGPFPGNAPPYLAYGLVTTEIEEELLKFHIQAELPTAELSNWLIGSDGVSDLIDASAKLLPGKTEPVGPLSQFWDNDRFFNNPDYARRRLSLANRELTRPNWEERRLERFRGLLPDDTTLVAGRKIPKES